MKRRLFCLTCGLATVRGWGMDGCESVPPADRLAQARGELRALAERAACVAPPERIAWVNGAINNRLDGAPDPEPACAAALRWHLPDETLARGAAGCADSAIVKFFLLLAVGTPARAVRLLYAFHHVPDMPARRMPHLAVLAREPFIDPLVLDAINLLAIPLSWRDDLDPVFSFDRERVWAGTDGPDQGSAVQRLRPWRELLARGPSSLRRAEPAAHSMVCTLAMRPLRGSTWQL